MLKKILSFIGFMPFALGLWINTAVAKSMNFGLKLMEMQQLQNSPTPLAAPYAGTPNPILSDPILLSLLAVQLLVMVVALAFSAYVVYYLFSKTGKKCPECGQTKPATKKVANYGESVTAKQ